MPHYSIIIPVYNRIDEVEDLLDSLDRQTLRDFETIIVEDGSTLPCRDVAERHAATANVRYFFKPNEGRSIARNLGMAEAKGDYFIFFDSDCVIPPTYLETLDEALRHTPLDCFGGPDAAHESFSVTQKAINVAMTSFLTTGGIRGGKVSLEKFTPRTFNMGFSRRVYEATGGFREMFSEDIDMSTRIRLAGFSIGLIHEAAVYHKRRIDFRKFIRQVYVFGMSRVTLYLLYPDTLKIVHWLPAIALIGALVTIALAIFVSAWWLLPGIIYLISIWLTALISTRDLRIATLAIPASVIQICGYGYGFLKAYITKIIFRKGRDIQEEINMRRGK